MKDVKKNQPTMTMREADDYLAAAPHFEIPLDAGTYPSLLAQIPDPPGRLYCIGHAGGLYGGLAVVGARKATPYGLDCATHFARRAASCGIPIISGGAIGCDQAALLAGVEEGVSCIFVAAGGADQVYPRGAVRLAARIVQEGGAIISEQPWGAPPLRHRFVARNRIIAGLAEATLVVEAGLPSGTFQTADAAMEAGREVWGVPGCIHSPESQGTNRLIRDGAQAVVDMDSFDTLLTRVFGIVPNLLVGGTRGGGPQGLSEDQQRLLKLLKARSARPDEICRALAIDQMGTMLLLSECESTGLIVRYPDGRFGVPVSSGI